MRCRVGDLAIIIGGLVPQNVGRIVHVQTLLGPATFRGVTYTDFWKVVAVGPLHDAATGKEMPPGTTGLCQDKNLQPIRPLDRSETTEREKELQC